MRPIAFAFVLLVLAGSARAAVPADSVRALGEARFAYDLYGRLRATPGNLVVSPHSVASAIAMAYVGARGRTAQEIDATLGFAAAPESLAPVYRAARDLLLADAQAGAIELGLANSLWGEKSLPLLPAFLGSLEHDYGAPLHLADFVNEPESARVAVNEWAAKETLGRVSELLHAGDVDSMTRLVLTSAIFFLGTWATPFDTAATRPGPFTLAGGKSVTASFMGQEREHRYMENDSLQVLELPYSGGRFSMTLLRPRQKDGLPRLEAALTAAALAGWDRQLAAREVSVELPRFRFGTGFDLTPVLGAMGMPDAFAQAADFSGMTGRTDLFVSKVAHQAWVEVDEKGTVAAAATGVVVNLKSAIRLPVTFRADRPFLFLIRHRPTGAILFLGRVANPAA